MSEEFVDLLPSEIHRDPQWNCRKVVPRSGEAESPAEALGAEQFQASIRTHGVMQPPCVRNMGGDWWLVYGFRRVNAAELERPEEKIRCRVLASTGDEKMDEVNARVLNLVENLHRENLRPWEIAEGLYQVKEADPSLTFDRLAELANLSRPYVTNLVTLRKRAHSFVWEQFVRWGTKMKINYHDVLKIVTLPSERQVDAWNKLLEEIQNQAKDPSMKRGREKKPGPVKLRKFYHAVDSLKSRPSEYRKGLKFGLAIALGLKRWPFDASYNREQADSHGNGNQEEREE